MMEREELLSAVIAANWNATAAARAHGINPNTFQHWLKVRGIKRPTMPKREEHHPPVALLMAELGRLRRHAALLRTNYLPTPARAAMLRENELAQRAVLAKVRATLGERPVFGGVRGSQASGVVRAAWSQRW